MAFVIQDPKRDALASVIHSGINKFDGRENFTKILAPNTRLMLDEAKQLITDTGLLVVASVVKADKKYKGCLAFEVVGIDHRPTKKVNTQTPIIIYYITQEVILQSQELDKNIFQEQEATGKMY